MAILNKWGHGYIEGHGKKYVLCYNRYLVVIHMNILYGNNQTNCIFATLNCCLFKFYKASSYLVKIYYSYSFPCIFGISYPRNKLPISWTDSGHVSIRVQVETPCPVSLSMLLRSWALKRRLTNSKWWRQWHMFAWYKLILWWLRRVALE